MIPNGVGGQCTRCGLYVPTGQGTTRMATDEERLTWSSEYKRGWRQTKWVTEHAACREAYEGTLVHWKWQPADARASDLPLL